MNDDRGPVLLALARASIEASLGGAPVDRPEAPWLHCTGASFVTLRRGGRLRGCIGTIEPRRPLGEDVEANAVAAASRDPRFRPVEAGELRELRVEVGIVMPLAPLEFRDQADALGRMRPGIDGVVLAWGGHRGVFLPQVWDKVGSREEFLDALKEKAGLAPDFWAPDVRLWRFDFVKWSEAAAADEVRRGA